MPVPPAAGKGGTFLLDISSHNWGNVESPWIGADLSIWSHLIRDRTPIRYPAKSCVFWQGREHSTGYIVAKGRVCISAFHEDGKQKQIYIATPGAMIGEEACILSQPYMTTATAIVTSELYAIPSKELQALFHSEQRTADLMLQYESRKIRMMISQTAMLSFDSAEQRIAKMLLCLCDAYGKQVPEGILINLSFTCTDLAGIVSTSRVTANNVLLDFARAGVLSKESGHYLIRKPEYLQGIVSQLLEK